MQRKSSCACDRGCSRWPCADGSRFELPFDYLRVHSPSAEVKGHGPGQEVLVLGKENVTVKSISTIGQYAVRLADLR